ncbi:MAG TPA: SRPBCC domain-containing protein [Bryobacteraceae bacterium]|nr:SRPBCC domain-containing protein [Bryobacteraceae bacterium]
MNPASVSESIVDVITIQASAARIFEALTNPAERMKWWGMEGRFVIKHIESDLRPGGKWLMSGDGVGHPFRVSGIYRKVEPPRLPEFTWLPDWQGDSTESVVRFELEEKDGATTVRLTHSGLSETARTSHRGWPQILGWLQAFAEQKA